MRALNSAVFGIAVLALAGCGGGGGGHGGTGGGIADLTPAYAPGQGQKHYSKVVGGVRVHLRNAGTADAPDSLVRVYFQTQGPISGTPHTWAAAATTGVVPAGASASVIVARPPAHIELEPDVQLIIVLDADEEVIELSDGNNVAQDHYV